MSEAADIVSMLERALAVDTHGPAGRAVEERALRDEARRAQDELNLAHHNLREMHALLETRHELDQMQARRIEALEKDLGLTAAKLRAAELELVTAEQQMAALRRKAAP